MSRLADAVRRLVDIAAAALGLMLLSPLLLATAIAVRLRLGSPVLFRQRRLGRGGVPFELLKFRSMAHAAPGREGSEFDEERLGRLGHLIRSTSLDELPSLLNLLRGQISLVGPRPLPVHYLSRYSPAQRRRLEVRPGITGLAQVSGRNSLDWPARLAFDVEYVEQRSLWLDVRILVRTVGVVFGRGGVNHGHGVTMHALPPQPGSPEWADRSAD